ncbi:DUF484 family protein [Marinihelvus fidelis]|uniref:DUF484 family protein n=1 Tax=Marinihelvus fidelis TaxID=2613842 RepID=A0A5N0T7I3_9GAMM|nr:DUF484 family protein [Marinihelvus fidelis]KAA9130852.1 DUF484 family protein [Marinihelvus fidelis]
MTDTRLDDNDVKNFLQDNPGFLVDHPDLLAEMQLPHESGEAVSLIEKQVNLLRDQNRKLSRQLNQLIRVATDNEALMDRLHGLTLELILVEDTGAFFDRLAEVLLEEFDADILNISLFEREIKASDSTPLFNYDRDDPELKPFAGHLEKGKTVCGRLNKGKLEFLFRSRAQWVQSSALVPLGDAGMMAIGSSDPARFYPGMGTLFLDLLARVIVRKLELTAPEQQRRSA